MIIFPAIDLKNGHCVRLYKGDMDQATIFNDNPAAQAREFESQGFKYLHVVDLDGAVSGNSVNEKSVKEIFWVVVERGINTKNKFYLRFLFTFLIFLKTTILLSA